MIEISVDRLVQITGAEPVSRGCRTHVSGVSTDSRHVPASCAFFALHGDKFDGNKFASDASGKAAAVVVSKITGNYSGECSVLLVHDTLAALQTTAAWWRQQLTDARVIAVTGSSGKTGTKDMVRAILNEHFTRVAATAGNLNNHVGVPLSILSAPADTQAAVWELGMNHVGELAPLCAMVQPQVGIITHIGSAHVGLLGSRDAIAQEKCSLARALPPQGCMIYPAEDDYASYIASQTKARLLPVGGKGCAVQAKNINTRTHGSDYVLYVAGEGEIAVHLPVPGSHMIGNSLMAAAACRQLGCSLSEIARGLAGVSLTGGRLTCREEQGILLVDDTYNANPESMLAALRTVASMHTVGKRIAVLGKMGELGSEGIAAHTAAGHCAAQTGYAAVIVLGEGCAELHALTKAVRAGGVPVQRVESPQAAAAVLHNLACTDDIILFKGSRAAGVERVMQEFLNHD